MGFSGLGGDLNPCFSPWTDQIHHNQGRDDGKQAGQDIPCACLEPDASKTPCFIHPRDSQNQGKENKGKNNHLQETHEDARKSLDARPNVGSHDPPSQLFINILSILLNLLGRRFRVPGTQHRLSSFLDVGLVDEGTGDHAHRHSQHDPPVEFDFAHDVPVILWAYTIASKRTISRKSEPSPDYA